MEDLLGVVRFLAFPFNSGSTDSDFWSMKPTDSPNSLLLQITEKCWREVELLERNKVLVDDSEASSSWKLSCTILDVLTQLKTHTEEVELYQSEEQKSIEVLSLQTQLCIQKCVELIIGFGILPYLLPGVGIPPKLRKTNPAAQYFSADDRKASPLTQFHRLSHVLESLIEICKHPTLNNLIVPKHISDILAGMLQICKVPIAKPDLKNMECKSGESAKPNKSKGLSLEEYESVISIQARLGTQMEKVFLVTVPKRMLVNSLFVIGATEKPRWMRKSCNEILYGILHSTNGLITISEAVLKSMGRSSVWKVSRVISNLIQDSVNHYGCECESDRFTGICSQCVQMVMQRQKITSLDVDTSLSERELVGVNQDLIHIGLFCATTLMDLNCQVTHKLIWAHLFDPVLRLGLLPNTNTTDNISVNIKEIEASAMIAESLLSLAVPMNCSLPLNSFQPIWSLLFQIFVTSEKYLRRKVQESNVAEAAQTLHSKLENVLILLLEVVISAHQSGSTEECSLSDFCIQLILNEGNNGNIILNRFNFESTENDEGKEPTSDNISTTSNFMVKIVSQNAECQNPDDNAFELLSDDCEILASSVLKNERVKHITSKLFCQLLSYEHEDEIIDSEERSNECNSLDEMRNENHLDSIADKSSSSFFKDRACKTENQVKFIARAEGKVLPTSASLTSRNNVVAESKILTQLERSHTAADSKKFIALKLLSDLGEDESVVEKCMEGEDAKESLRFVELIMRKLTQEMDNSSRTGEEYEFGQSVIFALGILGTICETACGSEMSSSAKQPTLSKKSTEIWDQLEIFVPHLRKLSESSHIGLINCGVPATAEDILITIESKGDVSNHSKEQKKKIHVISRYERALMDVANPILPIKGHGLLELRRLVQERDSETLKNEDTLLKIFQMEMKNEDSYVYLMAIQGMSTLGLKYHKTIVPVLIQEYDFQDQISDEDENSRRKKMYELMNRVEVVQFRMKIGEALVSIIRRLGSIAPMYRVPLTNVFFRLVRDADPLMRASALSNLGELCHLLKFTLGTILTEVWYCVECILKTEKEVAVRRAALHLVVLLLKGVVNDFESSHIVADREIARYLRDVRRLLTQIQETESDMNAKTHSQLAIQELELIVKKLLTPNDKIEYKIRV